MSSLAATPRTTTEGFYVWSVDGKPVSVHLSADVIRRIAALLPPEAGSGATRKFETGGVLLGRFRQAGPDQFVVAVEDFEPIECEHVRGASWILSKVDREQLRRRIRKLNPRDGLETVGWFRSHTRRGLFLDQHDLEMFREFFPQPATVSLIVRPGEPPVAGFFFWESGDIHRSTSYRAFNFSPEIAVDRRTAAEPLVAEAAQAAPMVTSRRPAATAPPPPRADAPRHLPWTSIRRAALLWTPVAAGVLAGVFWQPDPFRRPAPQSRSRVANEAGGQRAVFPPPGFEVDAPVPVSPPESAPELVRTRKSTPRRQFVPAPVRQPSRMLTPVIEAPPTIEIASVRHTGMPSLRLETAPLLAEASVEPARASALRRVVGSVPGLGFLKRKRDQQSEDFVPARAIRQVRPPTPASVPEEVPVRVRLDISDTGEVVNAELLTRRVDDRLARLALDAAKRWRFEPAQLEAHPVSTEVVVQFRFNAAPRSN